MTDSGYGPFFLPLLDSRESACLIFFLLQPSDLDGSKERFQDAFLLGHDSNPLIVDLIGSRESLAGTHMALDDADGEAACLHAYLVEADRRFTC